MKVNKNQVFLLIIALIALVMLIDKSVFLLRSGFAEGEIIENNSKNSSGLYGSNSTHTFVKFVVANNEILFNTEENANYSTGEKVKVIYLKSDITNARIFSFSGYWIPGFTRGLFVFIILSGIVYAFMRPNEVIEISFKKSFLFNKKHNDKARISRNTNAPPRGKRNLGQFPVTKEDK